MSKVTQQDTGRGATPGLIHSSIMLLTMRLYCWDSEVSWSWAWILAQLLLADCVTLSDIPASVNPSFHICRVGGLGPSMSVLWEWGLYSPLFFPLPLHLIPGPGWGPHLSGPWASSYSRCCSLWQGSRVSWLTGWERFDSGGLTRWGSF